MKFKVGKYANLNSPKAAKRITGLTITPLTVIDINLDRTILRRASGDNEVIMPDRITVELETVGTDRTRVDLDTLIAAWRAQEGLE